MFAAQLAATRVCLQTMGVTPPTTSAGRELKRPHPEGRYYLPGTDRYLLQLRPPSSIVQGAQGDMVAWASLSEWLGNTKHRLRMGGLTSDSSEHPRAAVFAAIGAPDHIAAPDCLLDEACEDDGYETVLLSPSLEDTDEGLSGAATAAATAFINKAKGCRIALSNPSVVQQRQVGGAQRVVERFSILDQGTNRIRILQRTYAWLRRLAWLWRGRVVGWLTGPETQSYWSLLNSGRDSAQTGPALVKLVGTARYDAGRRPPSPKLRPLVGPGGTTAILRCQWPKTTVGLRWTCLGSSPPASSYATIDCEPLSEALHLVWQKAGP